MNTSENVELECRVCRCGEELNRPLYTPCMCSGSIGLVHQDCLEAWLEHSKKDTCELCLTKYQFEPQYQDNAPDVVPIQILFKSAVKLTLFNFLPLILRLICAIFVWIICVPVGTTCIYCLCIGRHSILTGPVSWMSLKMHISYGIVIDSVIALSLLTLMTFTDFLRFHWVPAHEREAFDAAAVDVGNDPEQPVPAPPDAADDAPGAPVAAVDPAENEPNIIIEPDMASHGDAIFQRLEHEGQTLMANSAASDVLIHDFGQTGNLHHPTDTAPIETTFAKTDLASDSMNMAEIVLDDVPLQVESLDENGLAISTGNSESVTIFHDDDADYFAGLKESTPSPQLAVSWGSDTSVIDKTKVGKDTEFNQKLVATGNSKEAADDPFLCDGNVAEHDKTAQRQKTNSLRSRSPFDDNVDINSMIPVDSLNHQPLYPRRNSLRQSEKNDQLIDEMGVLGHYGLEFDRASGTGNLMEPKSVGDEENVVVDDRGDEAHIVGADTNAADESLLRLPMDQNDEVPAQDNEPHVDQEQPANDDGGIGGVPANAFFEENDFADFEEDVNDPPEVGGEIQIALFELLGFEGPFHLMFRNALWLLGFCSLYLTSVVSLPYLIGRMLTQRIVGYGLSTLYLLETVRSNGIDLEPKYISTQSLPLSYTMRRMMDFLPNSAAHLLRAAEGHSLSCDIPIQFVDFIFIALGFVTIFVSVFVIDFIAAIICKLPLLEFLRTVSDLVNRLAVVVKVGILLILRIFLLPVILGGVILVVSSTTLFPYTTNAWAKFLSFNTVGAYELSWLVGITFMLLMTISVLQLREVLHPDIFGKLVRPQEPHMDLITSLINETTFVHIRRIFVSLTVYLVLMVTLLWAPMLMLKKIVEFSTYMSHRSGLDGFQTTPTPSADEYFTLRVWYILPEIQLPLELFIAHAVFLTLLDTHKNIIGIMQHYWLKHVATYLGLHEFVLPNVRHPHGTVAVLQRPPTGWDLRGPRHSTRWAWGTEEPSETEKRVLARVVPTYWLLRCTVLLSSSWIIISATTIFTLSAPLLTGRGLLQLIKCPPALIHDPFCFLIGTYILLYLMSCIHFAFTRHGAMNRGNRLVLASPGPQRRYQQWLEIIRKLNWSQFFRIAYSALLLLCSLAAVGFMIAYSHNPISIFAEINEEEMPDFDAITGMIKSDQFWNTTSGEISSGSASELDDSETSRTILQLIVHSLRSILLSARVSTESSFFAYTANVTELFSDYSAILPQSDPDGSLLVTDIFMLVKSGQLWMHLVQYFSLGCVALLFFMFTMSRIGEFIDLGPSFTQWLQSVKFFYQRITAFVHGNNRGVNVIRPPVGHPLEAVIDEMDRMEETSPVALIDRYHNLLHKYIVLPMFDAVALESFLLSVAIALVITCFGRVSDDDVESLDSSTTNEASNSEAMDVPIVRNLQPITSSRFFFVLTAANTLIIVYTFTSILMKPAQHTLLSFYTKIRDDNYLIGRRLVNSMQRRSDGGEIQH